jgi:hypothetical protein
VAEIKATLELKGWNSKLLAERAGFILEEYGTVMDKQLKEEIQAVNYQWPATWPAGHPREGKPRITYRRNGQKVRTPRNIVDLGGLLKSQRKEYAADNGKYQLTFTWDAKSDKGFMYAGLILTGYVVGPRGTVVPPRNWIKPALDKHPLDSFFIAEWRKLSRNAL